MNTININIQGEIRFPDLLALAKAIADKTITAPAPKASVSVVPRVVVTAPSPDPAPHR